MHLHSGERMDRGPNRAGKLGLHRLTLWSGVLFACSCGNASQADCDINLVTELRTRFPEASNSLHAAGGTQQRPSPDSLVAASPDFADGWLQIAWGTGSLRARSTHARHLPRSSADSASVYRDAYANTDVVHVATPERVEEWLYLRNEASPHRFEYEVRVEGGTLRDNGEVVDIAGNPRVRLVHPYALDAVGRRVDATLSVAQGRVVVELDTTGLTYPVLLDPSWELTAGAMVQARSEHALAMLGDGRLMACGGTSDGTTALKTCELMNPHDGAWQPATDMQEARRKLTLTVLQNGHVLACGGDTSSCDYYDPWAAVWSPAPAMKDTRAGATATLLRDGRVLMVAGGTGSAETLVPGADQWVPAGSISPREGATATLLGYGKVLVVGGMGQSAPLANVDLYDPSTNAWSALPPLSQARAEHTATRMRTDKVFVAGGSSDGSNVLDSALLFDETTTQWTATQPMREPRKRHGAILRPSGEVLLLGGRGASAVLSSTELFDGAGFWPANPLTVGREACVAAQLPTGDVVASGGRSATGSLSATEVFGTAPANDGWGRGPSMIERRSKLSATVLPDGTILVTGGDDHSHGCMASAEQYVPALARFMTLDPVSQRRCWPTATLLADGTVLVAGGNADTTSTEVFNYQTKQWTLAGELKHARFGSTATRLADGKVLIAGGSSTAEGDVLESEVYDPSSHSSSASGLLRDTRSFHAASLLPNGKVLISGGLNRASTELYDPSTGAWGYAGGMHSIRSEHTSTVLADGRVLVAGGTGSSGPLATVELYDPATGVWTVSGSLSKSRSAHSAVLLPDNRVLVTGGLGDALRVEAEVFDPSTNQWSLIGSLSIGRRNHASVLLGNRVFVLGGDGGTFLPEASSEVLDVSTAASIRVTSPLLQGRASHTATLLADGRVLLAGGTAWNNGFEFLASAELYDPGAGEMRSTGGMVTGRSDHTATLLPGGSVLITGGQSVQTPAETTDSIELYDPATETFTEVAHLSTPRWAHTANLLRDGRVLIAGGLAAAGNPGGSAEVYDPATGNSAVVGAMSQGRSWHTSALLNDGRVLVEGGHIGSDLFDPLSSTFSAVVGPSAEIYHHKSSLLGNGSVLIGGGQVAGGATPGALVFDPSSGSFSSASSMTDARYTHTATPLVDGKVLFVGGEAGNIGQPPRQTAELFDPTTRTFSLAGTMSKGRFQHTATPLLDGTVLIAGGRDNSSDFFSLAEVYQPRIDYQPDWQPSVVAPMVSVAAGGAIRLVGSGFRGMSSASGDGPGGAAADHPIVELIGMSTQTPWWIAPTDFTDTSLTFAVPAGHALEPSALRVIVAGIPSKATILHITTDGLGATCASGAGCLSGHCVDGVCCAQSSCSACSSCNVALHAGTCSLLPPDHDDTEPAGTCDGVDTCDGRGHCLLKKIRPCSLDAECASRHCTDGVCCNTSCASTCQACNVSGSEGTCVNLPSGAQDNYPANTCAAPAACDGLGACRKQLGIACVGANECASGYCIDSVCCSGACNQTCMSCVVTAKEGTCSPTPQTTDDSPACWNGHACDGTANGASACKLANGSTCADASACASGYCVDGVCCHSSCDTPCSFCGAAGICGFVPSGQQDSFPANACASGSACDGAGDCKAGFGQACGASAECLSGFCTDSVCCQEACDTSCFHCIAGGSCVPSSAGAADGTCTGSLACDGAGACKQSLGGTCSIASDCASGFCVDGLCCDSPCTGLCTSCRADRKESGPDGECGNAKEGMDPRDECPADLADTCQRDGSCSGFGTCKLYGPSTACGVTSCTDGSNGAHSKRTGKSCDGFGGCVDIGAQDCGLFRCAGEVCGGGCAASVDCITTAYCDPTGQCVARASDGEGCASDEHCLSAFCVDGVCCNTQCDGKCQACSAAAKGLGADGMCGPTGAGTDDAGDCDQDPQDTCGKTGLCDGIGGCQLYALGAPCGSSTCADDAYGNHSIESGSACNGLGDCSSNSEADCQLFRCADDTCAKTCSTDVDCIVTAYCTGPGGTCQAKANNGAACAIAHECATGFCADGVCCETACTGQCEACDLPDGDGGLTGKCVAVTGEPRGQRAPCENAGEECGGVCDGNATSRCTFPNEAETCGVKTCTSAVEHQPVCDGQGVCSKTTDTKCVKFACGQDGCKSSCTSDDDCAAQFKCDLSAQDCVPTGARCDGDHTLVSDNAPPQDCSPFVCTSANVCANNCTSRADCIAGMACTVEGKCEPSAAGAEAPAESGCGCAVPGESAGGSDAGWLLSLLVAGVVARRARRKARSGPRSVP